MTNLNLPSGQREALADLLATKDVDVLREMLQLVYHAAIEAQFDEHVGADRYERTDDRHDLRNGSRRRDLNTRAGDLDLVIPRAQLQPVTSSFWQYPQGGKPVKRINYRRAEDKFLEGVTVSAAN